MDPAALNAKCELPLGRSQLIVDDSNMKFYDYAVSVSEEIEKNVRDRIKKIRELNKDLPSNQRFYPIVIVPRRPKLLMAADYYKDFCLDETSPTTLGCKRFTRHERVGSYDATTMLQIFSLKFDGEFPSDLPMLVYGFIAVRDDVEPLRNYIFKRSRENPCELSPGSPMLQLMCPSRGISVFFDTMIEYALKIKLSGDDGFGADDAVLIDGCIHYDAERIRRDRKLKSRIDGPLGPFDMEYVFIRHGTEAVVEIAIPKYLVGDRVKITALTSGYRDSIALYDGLVLKRFKLSSVMTVSLGRQLKVKLKVTISDSDPRCAEFEEEMIFNARKRGSSKGEFRLLVKDRRHFGRRERGFVRKSGHCHVIPVTVTWSTMGY